MVNTWNNPKGFGYTIKRTDNPNNEFYGIYPWKPVVDYSRVRIVDGEPNIQKYVYGSDTWRKCANLELERHADERLGNIKNKIDIGFINTNRDYWFNSIHVRHIKRMWYQLFQSGYGINVELKNIPYSICKYGSIMDISFETKKQTLIFLRMIRKRGYHKLTHDWLLAIQDYIKEAYPKVDGDF